MELAEAVDVVNELIARANMCFTPANLEFLRAGGRVSNVAFLGASILNLHPCIELLDGKLMATKKYRGKMQKVAAQLITDYADHYKLNRKDKLWIVYTIGLSEEVKDIIKNNKGDDYLQATVWNVFFFENQNDMLDVINKRKGEVGKTLLDEIIIDLTNQKVAISKEFFEKLRNTYRSIMRCKYEEFLEYYENLRSIGGCKSL